jgi:transposase
MTWTEITRCQHDRRALRYASDCTDAEWALINPLMPGPSKVMGCDAVHCDDGMPMGAFAKGFSSLHDGAVLFLWPARQRGYWI